MKNVRVHFLDAAFINEILLLRALVAFRLVTAASGGRSPSALLLIACTLLPTPAPRDICGASELPDDQLRVQCPILRPSPIVVGNDMPPGEPRWGAQWDTDPAWSHSLALSS